MKFKSWGIKMILFGDYHTHTQYSHGKGTILDNAKVAESKGLKEIAITDHGFGHQLYGAKRQDIENILRDIKKAKKETGVNILYGVEGNFVDRQGNIDVTADDYSKMDILLVGHHNFVRSTRFSDKFPMFYRNMLSGIWAPSKQLIENNTAIYLRAFEKNKIDVITHLNYGMKVDTMEVARAAKQVGTFIELNGKRILFTDDEIVKMAEEGVKFILNSDAHTPNAVGECNRATNLIRRLEIPLDRVVNINKFPIFHKGRN